MWKKYKAQSKKRLIDDSNTGDGNGGGGKRIRQFKDMSTLNGLLNSMKNKGYGTYNELTNFIFKDDLFDLMCIHVQGDPYATPSVFSLYIPPDVAKFPQHLYSNTIRQTALADYIGRRIESGLDLTPKDPHQRQDASVKGGTFTITNRPQQILERSDVVFHEGGVDIRFKFSLPARGRTIMPSSAIYALVTYLPFFVRNHLLWASMDSEEVSRFVDCAEDQEWIRSHLQDNGLVAFVPDGAMLSRSAGDTDTPNLDQDKVVPFKSPQELKVAMDLPSGKHICGMGIPPGITLVTGGGYHGKSTLLRALEMGIYNHIPGDGREYIATDKSAIKIRSEDGRWIQGVDVRPYISNLPFDTSTRAFSTSNASGSTSMAASIQEMVEADAKLFLYDEDSCATNFLVNDRRMRQLISKQHEPITPLVSRVQQLHQSKGVSSIMVTGVCFDFVYLANVVIEMRNYTARVVTEEARTIANMHLSMSPDEQGNVTEYGNITARRLKFPDYLLQCKIAVEKHGHINFKYHSELPLNLNDQLVEEAMTRTIKSGILHVSRQQQLQPQQHLPPTVLDMSLQVETILDRATVKTPTDLLGKGWCFLSSPLDTLFPTRGGEIPDLSRPPRTAFIYAFNRLRGTSLVADHRG